MIGREREGGAKRSEGMREKGPQWNRQEEQMRRCGYPDGFRHISGILERLEILG